MDSLFFNGKARADFAATEVLTKLQFVDLVFVLGLCFKGAHGSGDAEQSVALTAQLLGQAHGLLLI
jgi:hypothetical protein